MVKRYDASNNLIIDPEFADRNYSTNNKDTNYEIFCGYFKIKKNNKPIYN